jgi:zinc protease
LLLLAAVSLVFSSLNAAFGQTVAPVLPEPRREQLLNGLKILLVPRPGDPEVTLKLRIHSGAAFDLAGKEGMMALLGDALFSDPTTRDYVKEDLGGRLEVTTRYDSMDVLLTGRAGSFERLAELLRNAFLNTQLTPEVVSSLREARIKTVRETGIAPGAVADRAVAARLYGTYPYGRLVSGTPETLGRVERRDLLAARERLLGPDNATLVIIGGVEPSRALRTLRQYLGGWRKADRSVPATFRQPESPDARTLIINISDVPDAEVRLALRGVARRDRDSAAAAVLALLAQERWTTAAPELKNRAVSVQHDARLLGGVFRLSASVPTPAAAAQAIETARAVLLDLSTKQVSAAELDVARRTVVAALSQELENSGSLADVWLDMQTYGTNASESLRTLSALTPADMQRVAAKLFLKQPSASVAVGDAAKLSLELARLGEVEVLGAATAAEPAAPPKPAAEPGTTIRLKRP